MTTLLEVKVGENFLNGVQKDNFRNFNILRLKSKEGIT
jgi:hypothetical protein